MPPRIRSFVPWLVLGMSALFIAPSTASAVRTVYFADTGADALHSYVLGPGGALAPLATTPLAEIGDGAALALTPDGRSLYLTDPEGESVRQFDVDAGGLLTEKPTPRAPTGEDARSMVVSPDGRSAYVVSHEGRVWQYDVGARGQLSPKVPASVAVGGAGEQIALTPAGSSAYVLRGGSVGLFAVDAEGRLTRREAGDMSLGGSLKDIVITPDGQHAYVSDRFSRVLQFDVGGDGSLLPQAPLEVAVKSGAKPSGLAVSPDGRNLYVASDGWADSGGRDLFQFAVGTGGAITPLDPAHLEVAISAPQALAISPNGRNLYAAGGDSYQFDVGANGLLAPKQPLLVSLGSSDELILTPNQAPVASFSVTPGPAGSATVFDASGSLDPDGSIVRYDWDFGDGVLLPDGGPAPTHVYSSPGAYTATVTITDDEGTSTSKVFTGGSVLENGGPSAHHSVAFVVDAAPEAPPSGVPPPVMGESVVVQPARGVVRIRPRGSRRYARLAKARNVPVGSTIDTKKGRVSLTSAKDARGGVQAAVFHSGLFTVKQKKSRRPVTEVVLRGPVAVCPRPGEASRAASRRRRLWGSGRGRFRSRGRHSSATVRGTTWLVEDRCDGTLTLVRSGTVAVRDFSLRKTILVRKGERYLARGER